MIGCEVSGGLGNQFFRYAFARSLQEHRKAKGLNDEFCINFGKIECHGFSGDLSDFNIIKHKEFRCRRLLLEKGSWWQIIIYAIVTKVFSRFIQIQQKYKILI